MDITESLIEGAVKYLTGRKTTLAFHLEGRDSKKARCDIFTTLEKKLDFLARETLHTEEANNIMSSAGKPDEYEYMLTGEFIKPLHLPRLHRQLQVMSPLTKCRQLNDPSEQRLWSEERARQKEQADDEAQGIDKTTDAILFRRFSLLLKLRQLN
ncbi:uncharacterized protein PHACADRAFT_201724 [Phanerochaete carnosa HHB-10118-sp]|uniref:Uncharacterized protein n=1 Tax=Phanerochaete carnosa (strain HHB-10118-sp) TaxID=650164 RepID=K5WGY0_PHACS|nr:uncharacterized protein PHACADRAFT_201724 [Phanerochaete carnosa HHB-10118-sp]EKM49462.1 hypothetical protein PHACADRAFT_201724 [Phanerochaete carnosa HHB-10118-sp]